MHPHAAHVDGRFDLIRFLEVIRGVVKSTVEEPYEAAHVTYP